MEMLCSSLLQGELVRLTAENPEIVVDHFMKWNRDTEYWRLRAEEPTVAYTRKQNKEYVENDLVGDRLDIFFFMIRSLADDRIIGEINLDGVVWNQGEAFVGIGIGERTLWNQGYGTDAMRVLLRYAFLELNLNRVSLTLFEYNRRAHRSYEKAGFTFEGSERGRILRGGQRWDLLYMGILRDEWVARYRES